MRAYRFLLVPLFSLALSVAAVGAPEPNTGAALVAAAQSQLGVREVGPPYRNAGVQVQAYLKVVGLRGDWAWCGAFVAWCSKVAHVLMPAGAGAAAAYFRDPARIVWKQGRTIKPPIPGDIVGYRWNRVNAEDHVGIIEVWGTGPTASTIEGNTSGRGLVREGQGVFRNWRHKSQMYQIARWAKN